MSAMKSGMSRKTAGKYLSQNDVTGQRRVPHTWRTREDPLEAIWPQAEEMLRQAPELEAKTLFEHLATGSKDGIKPGLLRTFQRRVKAWRLKEGPEKEVFFTQESKPGETLAVDWTDMKPLGITIQGKALDHKLFHAVLPYSNWEWAPLEVNLAAYDALLDGMDEGGEANGSAERTSRPQVADISTPNPEVTRAN